MSTELQILPDQSAFDDKQIAALRALGVEDAPAGDIAMLFHQSVRTGLDPFAKQIYLIGRVEKKTGKKKWTIQTGIDGFRVLRDRTKQYLGHTTEWCGPDGVWKDVWLDRKPPAAARVAVHVRDRVVPSVGIANWTEYAATFPDGNPMALWAKMPSLMLAKCAEALALRQAFPQDLSGIYIDEEMQQADIGADGVPSVTSVKAQRAVRKAHEGGTDVTDHEIADEWIGRIRESASIETLDRLYLDAKATKVLAFTDLDAHTVQQWFNKRHVELEQDAQGEPEQPIEDAVLVPDYDDETPF